jgi:class 3 adenylate cyclase
VAVEIPDPDYVKTEDGAYIAYQVVGDGPVDIAWQSDFGGNLDVGWESGWDRAWLEGLAEIGRVILHDWRGCGLSSRNVALPNLETRARDLRTVMDAAGSTSAVMGAWFESLAPCLLLAASDPSRVRALVWWNPVPRTVWAPDYPWGSGPDEVARERTSLLSWGTAEHGRRWADQFEQDVGFRPPEEIARWHSKYFRNVCTPDVAVALTEMWWETDVRGVLPLVQAPALILAGEVEGKTLEKAEYVASLMPDARIEAYPSEGWPITRDEIERSVRPKLDAIRRFVGIDPKRPSMETILSTVLMTDIVASTERQATLGDRAWKELIENHHRVVREALGTWRGVENDTAGDGFFATFDGPARAIHCALEIRERVGELGIVIRAGVHTGECEVIDGKHGGIAVAIGARISSLAEPSQVLVSQTVKDLVAGSGLTFEDAGDHELKGVPGSWHVYAAG